MNALLHGLQRIFGAPRNAILCLAGMRPLASGVVVYAIDVDGRRIIVAASPHAVCVLDRYPMPKPEKPAGAGAAGA